MVTNGADGVRHIDAIDGLRAVAVIAVLAFHADLGIARGGFLGVSLFFTLSGYLITNLLLREFAADGTISIRRFYARRWRRLTPSALISIAAVLAGWVLWSASQQRGLPGDALAALGNVANWRAAFADQSYQEIFIGQPSPLAHFWSLAIEEQFYAVMPIIALTCLRRSRHTLALTATVMLVASVVANVLTTDRDLVYNGTHTRAAELLVGVLLALYAPQIMRRTRPFIGWGALGAFGVLVATTAVTSGWLYRGGLPAFSVVSAMLVAAAVAPQRSALTTLLATRPLVAVGRWSYALYLVHWPIYLTLTAERTGLTRWPLLAMRTAIALGVAALVTSLVERPIRARQVFVRPRTGAFASLSAAVCIVIACVALPAPTFSDNERLLAAGEQGQIMFENQPADVAAAPETTVPVAPPVLVVGSGTRVPSLLRARGVDVIDATDQHCPITPALEVQLVTNEVVDVAQCPSSLLWLERAAEAGVTEVVVAFGAIDEGVVRVAAEVGFPPRADYHQLAQRSLHVASALNAFWDATPMGLNVHLLRVGSQRSSLQWELTRFAASRSALSNLHFSIGNVVDSLNITQLANRQALRVLVVGDSTSVILASALHRLGPGAVDVLWVGANGCPLVPIAAVRSAESEPWQEVNCPSTTGIVAEQLVAFDPDVVVLMASGVELLHQRYPGDDRDHVAGGAEYTRVHDTYMTTLSALLNEHAVPLLVADCPQLLVSDFVREETASPERIAAWNAQVQRWIDAFPNVALLPYASAINERQRANPDEAVLIDGIHADVDILTDIVRTQLFDVIVATAAG